MTDQNPQNLDTATLEQDIIDHIQDTFTSHLRRMYVKLGHLRKVVEKAGGVELPRTHQQMEELWLLYRQRPLPVIILVLAVLGDSRTFDELERMIREHTFHIGALQVIGYLGELRAMSILMEHLEHGNQYEVQAAAASVCELRHPAAVPVLSAKLTPENEDRYFRMVKSVERALKAIGTMEAIEALERWEEKKGK